MIMPKVTVLMPVYNGERYLREAIDSILVQSFTEFEFLVINDGSTDKSVEIAESYQDPRIRLIHNDCNLGLVSTLNKGLRLARGDFIARMDCDDYSFPSRLRRQYDFLVKNPDISFCGSWIELDDGENKKKISYPCSHDEIKAALLFGNSLAHPSVIIRRETLKKFTLNYEYADIDAEDYGLWVRASTVAKFANLPEVLVRYRSHKNQVSNTRSKSQRLVTHTISDKQLRTLFPGTSDDLAYNFTAMCEVFYDPHNWEVDVDKLRSWLQLLSELNALNISSGCYHPKAFRKACALVWERLCRVRGIRNFEVWSLYWSFYRNYSCRRFFCRVASNKMSYASYRLIRIVGKIFGFFPEW